MLQKNKRKLDAETAGVDYVSLTLKNQEMQDM
jgi:hypothetical protein